MSTPRGAAYLWSTYAGVAVSLEKWPRCVIGAHLARTWLGRGSVRAAGAWWREMRRGSVETVGGENRKFEAR